MDERKSLETLYTEVEQKFKEKLIDKQFRIGFFRARNNKEDEQRMVDEYNRLEAITQEILNLLRELIDKTPES